jgi:hypothetical protein
VELRADGAQREVCLGREQQDEHRGLVTEVAREQPQADFDSDECGGECGQQLEHERGHESHSQRRHRRAPVLLGDAVDGLRLRLRPAEHLQRRQPLHDVEEVAAKPDEERPLPFGPRPGVHADECHEQRDQRQRHPDRDRGDQVGAGDTHQHGDRHEARQRQLRQVAREVRVQRVEPAGEQSRELARVLVGQPHRPTSRDARSDLAPQLRFHRSGGPQRRGLGAVRRRRAQQHHHGERDQAAVHRGRAVPRADDDVGQQCCLGEHQCGGADAERDGRSEVSACGARVTGQPRVERFHPRDARSGFSPRGAGTRGSACTSARVTRLRNTQ